MTSFGEAEKWGEHVGEELRKSYTRYTQNGFFDKYLSGERILDIGYKGYVEDAQPIFPHATGIDLDYPGYDGKRLPFDDASQDAVFASHTLEHITHYREAIAEWFRVLRPGGHLVIAVPHQFLYERKLILPSRFNGDHKRFYTAASLLREIEESIDPLSFRVRFLEDNDEGFDYQIPPDRHACGAYEIVVVVQRIERPAYADKVISPHIDGPAPGGFTRAFKSEGPEPVIAIESDAELPNRILVLKLDHRGDFILAKSAFATLRQQLPSAHITLACGSWNRADAESLDLFDAVMPVDFFPEVASHGHQGFSLDKAVERFKEAVAGQRWDLAIDFRVDRDTRDLLKETKATHRAGFGTIEDFPFLDISLPFVNPTVMGRNCRMVLRAEQFTTRLGVHQGYAITHDGGSKRFAPQEFLIFGPYSALDIGTWEIEVIIEPAKRDFVLDYDVCSNLGTNILQVGKLGVTRGSHPRITLRVEEPVRDFELRLRAAAADRIPPFRFLGISAAKSGSLWALHQEEMQVLLADLVGLRMRNPFSTRQLAE